ncbi:hypothetical protein J7K27_01685 [Candidatus Bathyarchaeota archaeon]|nr:hypothetical protein [Candidatus Bathyarchaeota archaeon]
MKRISIVLGRTGTVLLATCLALTILLLIPPASISPVSFGMPSNYIDYTLTPKSFILINLPLTLNPQFSIKAQLSTNNPVDFYIIDLLRENRQIIEIGNLTEFKALMTNENVHVMMNKTFDNGNFTIEFTPDGLLNASFIIVNKNLYAAKVNYKIELLVYIAPNVRVTPVITYLSPIGAIFTGQWVFIELKNRKRKS